MGIELQISFYRRLIICTPLKSEHLDKTLFQKLAPTRGQEIGEIQKQKNLQSHLETKSLNINLINSCLKTRSFIWVGAFVVLSAVLSGVNTPKAQAATVGENLQVARQVIENVAPVVSSNNIDERRAALVFSPEGYVTKPMVAETRITQEPVKKKNISVVKPNAVFVDKTGGNHFAYGWCTYYVASRRNVPWFGNAGTWLGGAQKTGFATGGTPQVGAIIVTAESRWGHVGIVEAVNGDQVTISEMNYSGFGRISSRTIPATYSAIKGYIY